MAALNLIPSQPTTPSTDPEDTARDTDTRDNTPLYPDLLGCPASGDYQMPSFQDCLPNFPQERPVTPATPAHQPSSNKPQPDIIIIDSDDDESDENKPSDCDPNPDRSKGLAICNFTYGRNSRLPVNSLAKTSTPIKSISSGDGNTCARKGNATAFSVKTFYSKSAQYTPSTQDGASTRKGILPRENIPYQIPRSREQQATTFPAKCGQSEPQTVHKPSQPFEERTRDIPDVSTADTSGSTVVLEDAIKDPDVQTNCTLTLKKCKQEGHIDENQNWITEGGKTKSADKKQYVKTREISATVCTTTLGVNQDKRGKSFWQTLRESQSVQGTPDQTIQQSKTKKTVVGISKLSPTVSSKAGRKKTSSDHGGLETLTPCYCEVCGRKFLSEQGLRNHYMVIHPGKAILHTLDENKKELESASVSRQLTTKQKRGLKRRRGSAMLRAEHVDSSDSDEEAVQLIESQINEETETVSVPITTAVSEQSQSPPLNPDVRAKSVSPREGNRQTTFKQEQLNTQAPQHNQEPHPEARDAEIWKCNVCQVLFTSADEVMNHIQTLHGLAFCQRIESVPQLYYCHFCEQGIQYRSNAMRHFKSKHNISSKDKSTPVSQMVSFVGKIDSQSVPLTSKAQTSEMEEGNLRNMQLPDMIESSLGGSKADSVARDIKNKPDKQLNKSRQHNRWMCTICQKVFESGLWMKSHVKRRHEMYSCDRLRDLKKISCCLVCGNIYKSRRAGFRHYRDSHSKLPNKPSNMIKPAFTCVPEITLKQNDETYSKPDENLPTKPHVPGVGRPRVSRPSVDRASVSGAGVSRASVGRPSVDGASVSKAGVGRAGVGRAGVGRPSVDRASVSRAGVDWASVSRPIVSRPSVGRPRVSRHSSKEAVPTTLVHPSGIPEPNFVYRCKLCDTKTTQFTSKKKAVQHMRNKHFYKAAKLVYCSQCGQIIVTTKGFLLHVKSRHQTVNPSPVCLPLAEQKGKGDAESVSMQGIQEIENGQKSQNQIDLAKGSEDIDRKSLGTKKKRSGKKICYSPPSEDDDAPLSSVSSIGRSQLKQTVLAERKVVMKSRKKTAKIHYSPSLGSDDETPVPSPRITQLGKKHYQQNTTVATKTSRVAQNSKKNLQHGDTGALKISRKRKRSLQLNEGFSKQLKNMEAAYEDQSKETKTRFGTGKQDSTPPLVVLRVSSRAKHRPVRFDSPAK